MKASTMRSVDRWVGVPACALLTLHRHLVARRPPARPVQRMLFVKLAEQGSTVLAEAALRSAIERVGRQNVWFLAFEENRFILDAMSLIPPENVVVLDASSIVAVARSGLRAIRRLRRLRLDAAIDLEFFARSSAVFSYLSGAPFRSGLHAFAGEGPWRGNLLTHPLAYNPYLHTSELFLLLVQAIDQPADSLPAIRLARPEVPPHQSVRPKAEDLAAMRGLVCDLAGTRDLGPLILLNANCGDLLPLRRWDGHRYVELARRLLEARPELTVAFTGRPGEAKEAATLAGRVGSPRCVSLAGRTSLPQLLALYSIAEVLVTNDSGPAHFATLTPIDVVTLFGPETPALFAARTPRNHVLWAGLACSPCVSALNNRFSTCRNNLCMQALTVDQVFEATMAAYLGKGDAARNGGGREP